MKTYCQKCGAKIEFSIKSKPKFCHGCGASLGLTPDKASASTGEEAEDEEAVNEIPNLSGLEVDIATHSAQGETLGNVVGTAKDYNPSPFRNETTPLSKEEVREQFQKEAGTLRTSDRPAPPNEE